MTDDRENRAGQDIDGFPRPTMPFVGQTKGERRLRTLSFCVFKLRNFITPIDFQQLRTTVIFGSSFSYPQISLQKYIKSDKYRNILSEFCLI